MIPFPYIGYQHVRKGEIALQNDTKAGIVPTRPQVSDVRAKAVQNVFQQMEHLEVSDVRRLLDRVFIAGIPIPDFVNRYDRIREYIKVNQIPIETATPIHKGVESVSETIYLWKKWVSGGRKWEHLHMDGNVYLPSKPQWQAFLKEFVPAIKINLEQANQVSFEDLEILTDLAGRLG